MPHGPLEEEHRRLHDLLRRPRDGIEAAHRHLADTMNPGREKMKEAAKGIRDLLAAARNLPPRPRSPRPGKRPGEPDAGGVPVEPNNPRNLSGGAAVLPDIEP
jgi:hypothetical protein